MKLSFDQDPKKLSNIAAFISVLTIFTLILSCGLDLYATSLEPTATPSITPTPSKTRTPRPPTLTPTANLTMAIATPSENSYFPHLTSSELQIYFSSLGFICETTPKIEGTLISWSCDQSQSTESSQIVIFRGRNPNAVDTVILSSTYSDLSIRHQLPALFKDTARLAFQAPSLTSTSATPVPATITITPTPTLQNDWISLQEWIDKDLLTDEFATQPKVGVFSQILFRFTDLTDPGGEITTTLEFGILP